MEKSLMNLTLVGLGPCVTKLKLVFYTFLHPSKGGEFENN